MSPFPVELHIHILRQLPGRDPASTRAVASYLAACSVTRAAALDNAVWAHLYRDRYASKGVSEKLKESERHVRLQGDWHLMYIERYTIDRTALRLLDHIRAHPEDLQESAKRFALECSFDAWGALEIEAEVPISRAFRDPELDDTDQEAAQEALPRRFWANAALGALYRLQAIQTWCRVIWETDRCTFEEVLTVLSAFCDVPSYKIVDKLDALAAQCRERLTAGGLELDHTRSGFDVPRILVSIRDFILDEGFRVGDGPLFYHTFNQFPHFFLDLGRAHTIPMSMCHVFCAICRRLNIEVAPTNTPRKILCHITSPDPERVEMLFDPCDKLSGPPLVFSSKDLPSMLAQAGLPSAFSEDAVRPAAIPNLFARVINNLFSTMHDNTQHRDQLGHSFERAAYATMAAFFSINAGLIQGAVPTVAEDCPLDRQVVLIHGLASMLPAHRQQSFLRDCELRTTTRAPRYEIHEPRFRPMEGDGHGELAFRSFVGQVVDHPEHGLGCIIGWQLTAIPLQDPPRHMAHYSVLTRTGVRNYLDEQPFTPAPLTPSNLVWLRKNMHQFGRFFEDAHVPREDGIGGRLIPTMELRQQYPDDVEVGARWSEQQISEGIKGMDDA